MIQAKELRIGNFVKGTATEFGVIKAINEKSCSIEQIGYSLQGQWPFEVLYSGINPIKLTPEILEKCGFEMHKNKGLWRKGNFYLHFYTFSQNEYCFSYNNYKSTSILYLHQLQNLYYALTGKELEINL